MSRLQVALTRLKEEFTEKHSTKEDLFWSSRMGLSDDPAGTQEKLAAAEIALNRFLQAPERLATLRELESEPATAEENKILQGWIDMLKANVIEDPKARALSEEIVHMEAELASARRGMKLGYTDPSTGEWTPASSVKLSLTMRNATDEATRKAAFEGLRSIEDLVLEAGFLKIVDKRNQLGRMQGYEDYYDWRVHVIERMSKREIFSRLDELVKRTATRSQESVATFVEKHGDSARAPWNFPFLRSGALTKKLDPYFSFDSSVERWGRSFAAMGIKYRDATLTLDLIDREGKYENGFMHGPSVAFYDEGSWRPARINFTANAIPGQLGGGLRAIQTLFHEGGHAAHFSNILSNAPCFGHEFAPTSVAYAETQSMFLDSLLEDADWRSRYALDPDGNPMPWDLIEETIREQQPFKAWNVRAMTTVPFAERALYELPSEELEPERVLNTFRDIERDLQGLDSGVRPILSVPHLLDGDSSAYYHGYILAEMAVHQTRHFFLKRDGHLTDNPHIGPDLAKHYWASGNALSFQDTIEALTSERLHPDALVAHCNRSVDEAIAEAREKVDKLANIPAFAGEVTLDAKLNVIHGKQQVASTENSDFAHFAADFSSWINGLT